MDKPKPTNPEIDELFTNPEPWEAWEGKLVLWSILIALIASVILAIIINWLIL